MPQQVGTAVENNFTRGLITQATGLNFPENAVTETFNCEFNIDGSVSRRLGFDFESSFTTKDINRDNAAISTYLWKNVSGDGNVTIVVAQVGNTVYFYRITLGQSFSGGELVSTVTLTSIPGAPDAATLEAQYSDGNGLLFITHSYCNPIRVAYSAGTDVVTGTSINITIRDLEGSKADPYAVDTRPVTTLAGMNQDHLYNLYNQGWTVAGLAAWDTAQTNMPSNADVMWRFKDSSNNFDASAASITRVTAGNTPAPHGHFILNLSDGNRDGVAVTSGVAATTTNFQRPSTSTFFAGRVFYSGINLPFFNSNIYFTQIIENIDQYGKCYQVNDPTSEDLFDLLPSDGGVISIPDAGTIYKLVALPGGLGVFAANGVWFVSGSQGIGFTATDYTVQRIALIPCISACSFVNVGGYPAWWNAEGIYIIDPSAGGAFGQGSQLPAVKSLTYTTIKDFFDNIPINSKKYARGSYDRLSGKIHWLYKSTDTIQITQVYEFDRVLNFNVNTGAFYPWTITDSTVKVNSIIVADALLGTISSDDVVAGADNVIDSLGNQVIAYAASGLESSPFDKYFVSYFDADVGNYKFTFVDKNNADYLDWFTFDTTGQDFDSYYIPGYKLPGQAIRKSQSNWVRVYSRTATEVAYKFQGLWDFANVGDTGRWSVQQVVEHTDTRYTTSSRRLKVRGHGQALQFKISSVPGMPFEMIGWSALYASNAIP